MAVATLSDVHLHTNGLLDVIRDDRYSNEVAKKSRDLAALLRDFKPQHWTYTGPKTPSPRNGRTDKPKSKLGASLKSDQNVLVNDSNRISYLSRTKSGKINPSYSNVDDSVNLRKLKPSSMCTIVRADDTFLDIQIVEFEETILRHLVGAERALRAQEIYKNTRVEDLFVLLWVLSLVSIMMVNFEFVPRKFGWLGLLGMGFPLHGLLDSHEQTVRLMLKSFEVYWLTFMAFGWTMATTILFKFDERAIGLWAVVLLSIIFFLFFDAQGPNHRRYRKRCVSIFIIFLFAQLVLPYFDLYGTDINTDDVTIFGLNTVKSSAAATTCLSTLCIFGAKLIVGKWRHEGAFILIKSRVIAEKVQVMELANLMTESRRLSHVWRMGHELVSTPQKKRRVLKQRGESNNPDPPDATTSKSKSYNAWRAVSSPKQSENRKCVSLDTSTRSPPQSLDGQDTDILTGRVLSPPSGPGNGPMSINGQTSTDYHNGQTSIFSNFHNGPISINSPNPIHLTAEELSSSRRNSLNLPRGSQSGASGTRAYSLALGASLQEELDCQSSSSKMGAILRSKSLVPEETTTVVSIV